MIDAQHVQDRRAVARDGTARGVEIGAVPIFALVDADLVDHARIDDALDLGLGDDGALHIRPR